MHKIGLHYSTDGVKAFANRAKSFTPTEFRILSLPPTERRDPSNMLIHMIHETKLKPPQLAKYYDFAVQHELRDLYERGLDGTRITYADINVLCFLLMHAHTHSLIYTRSHSHTRPYAPTTRSVFVFGSTMDLKGRMAFMNMQTELSYYGCSVCTHRFEEGLRKKCHFTGARRFLPAFNSLRNTRTHCNHQFACEERRGPPTCTL